MWKLEVLRAPKVLPVGVKAGMTVFKSVYWLCLVCVNMRMATKWVSFCLALQFAGLLGAKKIIGFVSEDAYGCLEGSHTS